MLVVLYVILLVLGAKPTWKFAQHLIPSTIGDELALVVTLIFFAIIFLVAGPILGVVTAGKYLMVKLGSKTS